MTDEPQLALNKIMLNTLRRERTSKQRQASRRRNAAKSHRQQADYYAKLAAEEEAEAEAYASVVADLDRRIAEHEALRLLKRSGKGSA